MSKDFHYPIPNAEADPIDLALSPGQMLFVLGANGTGKSTLLHKMTSSLGHRATRLSAHRQIWFHSNSPDILASQRDQSLQNVVNYESNDQSRYMDNNASARNQLLLFDFIRENEKINSEIANAARAKDEVLVADLITRESPLAKLNRLIKAANLHFQITFDPHGRYLACRSGFPPYSISELSDGERAALLVILTVLNLDIDSVAILDEPERHLHKSIVSPMLTSLLLERRDVIFVISTHDISFAIDQPNSKALLLRNYDKNSGRWTYDYVEKLESIDESIAYAVLGGRRKILFVEGGRTSLDLGIYSVLFPKVSVFPAGPSMSIVQMVRSIESSNELHRISAFGLIDGDYLTSEKKTDLKIDSVYCCSLNSVESLYYSRVAIEFVAVTMARILSRDPQEMISSAITLALPCFSRNRDKLASLAAEASVREALLEAAPSNSAIAARTVEKTQSIAVAQIYDSELENVDRLIAADDYDGLVAKYSVKRSGIATVIAKALGFAASQEFEEAVRSGIVTDDQFAQSIKGLLCGLAEALAEQP